MKYTKIVAIPDYTELVQIFDQKFEQVPDVDEHKNESAFRTIVKLKINLRFGMLLSFPAKIELVKSGSLTDVKIAVNPLKIILACILMFILISAISYFVEPSLYALIYGFIAGLIVFFMSNVLAKRELENYLRSLLDID